jgi:hypothetical protein
VGERPGLFQAITITTLNNPIGEINPALKLLAYK